MAYALYIKGMVIVSCFTGVFSRSRIKIIISLEEEKEGEVE
jgi:hypothetical protein